MSRQLIATLVILVCGLVPDRYAGAAPRLRASLTAVCSTGPTPRGSSTAITSNCSMPAGDSTTWAICPPCAAAPRRDHLVGPRRFGAPGHAGRRPPRSGPEAHGRGPKVGRGVAHQLAGNARPVLRDRQARRDLPHRTGRRLDRRGMGSRRRGSIRVDPRTDVGRAFEADGRAAGRDDQLRRAGPFAGPALAPLQPGGMADEARPGDLRIHRGRRRLGRAEAPLRPVPRPWLRFAPLPGSPGLLRRRASLGPRASTSECSSLAIERSCTASIEPWPTTAGRMACRSSGC